MKRVAVLLLLVSQFLFSGPAGADDAIVDRAVAFDVVNKNDSLVPCQADNRGYTIRGSLIAPASVLASEHPAVTLYIHGTGLSGDRAWRMRPGGVKDFDFGYAMAQRGHASVSIELVGYGLRSSRTGRTECSCVRAHAPT